MAHIPDTLEITMPDGAVHAIGIRAVRSTVHSCPLHGSGLTQCCDRSPFELPRTDRLTLDSAKVTCVGGPR